tara:strand:- start:1453 stop:1782 length:330 start_codon:yes stop_codon:yes gene_type:complete
MATTFKNKVIKEIGPVPIIAIETDSNTRSTIVGLSLANLTGGIVYASIMIKDDTSITGYFLKEVLVPPNTSLRALSAGEKLILAPDNQLLLIADQDEALDAVISYVDIV